MTVLEPAAIRCGLLPADLWTMTIGEIEAVIKELTEKEHKRIRDEHEFLDLLNGKFCSLYASFHGVESCPGDHMVTKAGTAPPTPEEILDRAFASFSMVSTGDTHG